MPNLINLGQTLWAYVDSSPKLGVLGPEPLVWWHGWYPRKPSLLTCYWIW